MHYNRRLLKRDVIKKNKIPSLEDLLAQESAHPPSSHHRTVARKEANPEFYIPHIRVPRQYSRHPIYDYDPNHRSESISYYSREQDIYGPRRHFDPYNEERVLPESQRFFPSFPQGRLFSPGRPIHRIREASDHFTRRRPSFRNHGPFEAFPSKQFNDFGPVDNSILGSGNFEVIKGGTFYDNDDPHLNHNPYDPYLDNSYVIFPHSGNDHNHNHVDDFFSNFRDFSEFATRRSGTVHFDDGGYASEHVPRISSVGDMMTSESNQNGTLDNNDEILKETPSNTKIDNQTSHHKFGNDKLFSGKDSNNLKKLKPKQVKKYNFINKNNKKKLKAKSQDRKRPKNIQEVLEQVDPFPLALKSLSSDNIEEIDPLIAIF